MCPVSPAGIREKEQLLREEELGGGAGGVEAERSRRNMDVSLLREQYRSSRENQRKQSQVLLFRTGERLPADNSDARRRERACPAGNGLVLERKGENVGNKFK